VANSRVGLTLDLTPLLAIKSEAQRRSITLKAVKAAAKIIAPAAKARAPRQNVRGGGGLRQAIGIKAIPGRKGKSTALCVVGARMRVVKMIRPPRGTKLVKQIPGAIAHLVEKGTAAHSISRGASRGRGNPRKATSHPINHPGARPHPFLAPAWAASHAAALDAARKVLAEEIQKRLAKQAAKG
jgi:hypothetical protein